MLVVIYCNEIVDILAEPLQVHFTNKTLVKVSQPSRTYLVNVLAFYKAHPEWMDLHFGMS